MSYATMWKYRGGRKNNGRFTVFVRGRMQVGRSHKPTTKMAWRRKHTIQKKGWRNA
jgi:hypothetical protein